MPETTDRRDGLVHLYYGPGKGKSTAAMGLAVRAAGHGLSVSVLQFMKGAEEMYDQYGEVKRFRETAGIDVEQFPAGHAPTIEDLTTDERERLEDALEQAAAAGAEGAVDLLVLDEILTLYDLEIADADRLVDIIHAAEETVELVFTGRDAPAALVDAAEYVTYMGDIKHPFRRGVGPRAGIEY